eukprot:6208575-Pleurochrysis_carterae.AAC.6
MSSRIEGGVKVVELRISCNTNAQVDMAAFELLPASPPPPPLFFHTAFSWLVPSHGRYRYTRAPGCCDSHV